ncbi:MAG: sigma-70 family RNA polymerase sigma factor, partial [Acidobacteriota bacterium]
MGTEHAAALPHPSAWLVQMIEPAAAPERAPPAPDVTAAAPSRDPHWGVLARVAEGDTASFGALVQAYEARIVRLCGRFLATEEDARDAAQDVFLILYRKAGHFQPRGKVYTLLYRIAVNHCLKRLRRRKIATFLSFGDMAPTADGEAADAAVYDPADDAAPDADRQLLARERWRRTRARIDALPANQRAVVVLAKFEGLPYKRIAEVLEITEKAVESRLVRAMRRLKTADRE